MRFGSFLCILLGMNLVGIGIGSVIGYYLNEVAVRISFLLDKSIIPLSDRSWITT